MILIKLLLLFYHNNKKLYITIIYNKRISINKKDFHDKDFQLI